MGKTTVKRRSFCFTQETQRQIDELCERFGENASQVMIRAISGMHYLTFAYDKTMSKLKEDDENASQRDI